MAFTPFQGSDGRLKATKVAADLTVPAPTITGTTAAVIGITKWAVQFEDQHGEPIHHFESTATANGMLWGLQINGGTQVWKASVEGYFDGDSGTSYAAYELFQNGAWVKADFVYDKTVGTGHYGCGAKVSGWQTQGPGVKDGPVKFSCTLLGHGAFQTLTTS